MGARETAGESTIITRSYMPRMQEGQMLWVRKRRATEADTESGKASVGGAFVSALNYE